MEQAGCLDGVQATERQFAATSTKKMDPMEKAIEKCAAAGRAFQHATFVTSSTTDSSIGMFGAFRPSSVCSGGLLW